MRKLILLTLICASFTLQAQTYKTVTMALDNATNVAVLRAGDQSLNLSNKFDLKADLSGATFTGNIILTGTAGFAGSQFTLQIKDGSNTVGLSAYTGWLNAASTEGIYAQLDASNNLSFFGRTANVNTGIVATIGRDGSMTSITATAGTNTTQVATTAFVTSAISASGGGTVTNVSATNGAGQTFTITNPTTTPNISLALTKSAVGLGNVDNTSDISKPISTATQTALDLKANLTPVSASQTGLVNNTSLQELGGVDKLINGVNIGKGAGNGTFNTITGRNALFSNTTGNENTAVGSSSLFDNTTGSLNTAFGSAALSSNTNGSNNVGIGKAAGFGITTGINNTYIGQGTVIGNTLNTVVIASGTTNRVIVDANGQTQL